MDKDFWHERWEKNEIAFHMREVNPMLVKHFSKIALQKQKRIFIPLSGKTLDIEWLVNLGYKIVAIELNENAIKSLFRELDIEFSVIVENDFIIYRANNIEIFIGDFFDLSKSILGDVDFTYDRAALVALPKDMRKKYSSHLLNISNNASQLLISYEYDQNSMKGPPFSVKKDEIQEYYDDIYSIILLEENTNIPSGLKKKSQANEKIWLLQNN